MLRQVEKELERAKGRLEGINRRLDRATVIRDDRIPLQLSRDRVARLIGDLERKREWLLRQPR